MGEAGMGSVSKPGNANSVVCLCVCVLLLLPFPNMHTTFTGMDFTALHSCWLQSSDLSIKLIERTTIPRAQ